jgi:hypothetical protein
MVVPNSEDTTPNAVYILIFTIGSITSLAFCSHSTDSRTNHPALLLPITRLHIPLQRLIAGPAELGHNVCLDGRPGPAANVQASLSVFDLLAYMVAGLRPFCAAVGLGCYGRWAYLR